MQYFNKLYNKISFHCISMCPEVSRKSNQLHVVPQLVTINSMKSIAKKNVMILIYKLSLKNYHEQIIIEYDKLTYTCIQNFMC